jgi:hypothetical protein
MIPLIGSFTMGTVWNNICHSPRKGRRRRASLDATGFNKYHPVVAF